MSQFNYKAINADGKTIRGSMNANNDTELEQRLMDLQLDLISSKRVTQRKGLFSFTSKSIKRRDLIDLFFHLHQMTSVGIPVFDALDDLEKESDNQILIDVASQLSRSINEGNNLSSAMSKLPDVFTPIMIAAISAGEESGELQRVLSQLTESLKKQDELVEQTRKALRYPAFALTVFMGATVFLLVYLVPKLTNFITSLGHELPFYTKALIFTSEVIINYWHIIIVTTAVCISVFLYLLKTNSNFKLKFDYVILTLPVIGPTLKKGILARFSNYFSMLYESGVPVLDCIKKSATIADNKSIEHALSRTYDFISTGSSISSAFESVGIFPSLVQRMVHTGESTGDIGNALRNVSYFYERDTNDAIEKLQKMIEPITIMIVGGLLLWVMLSVLAPLYEIIGSIEF